MSIALRLRRQILSIATWFGAHRADQRDAHERDRARQRLAFSVVFGLLATVHRWMVDGPTLLDTLMPCLSFAYGAYAVFHLRVVLARPRGGMLSQYAFIVLDSMFTVVLMAAVPAVFAPLYPVLMVQIVRCGMRYGLRTLWLSWGAAAATAAVLLPLSPFWPANPLLLRSFLVMMLVIPPLMVPLVRRLQQGADELRAAAGADPLTGLANRRMLDEGILLAQEHCARDGSLLALVLLDLDNFKRVNDTLGHARGDRLLERVASGLRALARSDDVVARVGGDEFVLLVHGLPPDTGPLRAQALADAAVSRIRELADLLAPGLDVAASAGVCCWRHDQADGADPAELIARADMAMYQAKRSGKARATLAVA